MTLQSTLTIIALAWLACLAAGDLPTLWVQPKGPSRWLDADEIERPDDPPLYPNDSHRN